MNPQAPQPLELESRRWGWAVLATAVVIALCSAHDYAGGWNDGSRLATAESLVDYHTWSIDDSIFVNPSAVAAGAPAPYAATESATAYQLMRDGTLDKLLHQRPLLLRQIADAVAVAGRRLRRLPVLHRLDRRDARRRLLLRPDAGLVRPGLRRRRLEHLPARPAAGPGARAGRCC